MATGSYVNDVKNPGSDRTDPGVYFGEYIPKKLEERPWLREQFSKVQATAVVDISGKDGGVWNIVINGSDIQIHEGEPESSSFVVEISIDTFRQLRAKTLSPQNAFLRGKIKISGSVTTAMKLAALLKS